MIHHIPITLDRDTILVAYQRDAAPRTPDSFILVGISTSSQKSVILDVKGDNYVISRHGIRDSPPQYRTTYGELLKESSLVLARGVGQSVAIYNHKEEPHLNPERLLTIRVAEQDVGKTKLRFGLPADYDVMRGEVLVPKGVFLIQLAHTLELELKKMDSIEARL